MKRGDFLKGLGIVGAGAMIPFKGIADGSVAGAKETATCTLIPSETEGPYPLDTVSNSDILRTDIRETKTSSVQLNLKLKIIGNTNCLPIQNAWVKIWHCDKDGYYSGYSVSGYLGTQNNAGQTWLRGVQITDANGEVNFVTLFPGWYSGRICHIHFRVYLSSVLTATSQLTFPEATKNSIYTSNSDYSHGGTPTDPMTVGTDMVFSDGSSLQMATLTPNTTTGGYDSYLEVVINGTGAATGLMQLEPETAGQFKLKQNYPNPYTTKTTIPFSLANSSDVEMEIYSMDGRKVAGIKRSSLSAGDHTIDVDINSLGLASATYIYQVVVSNNNGVYRQCKVMTALK